MFILSRVDLYNVSLYIMRNRGRECMNFLVYASVRVNNQKPLQFKFNKKITIIKRKVRKAVRWKYHKNERENKERKEKRDG